MTHYNGTRTIRCLELPNCTECLAQKIARWQGYIIVKSKIANNFALLQFTPVVGAVLRRGLARSTGLLGVSIRLTRLGPRNNSPLHCEITGFQEDIFEFPTYRLEQVVKSVFQFRDGDPSKLFSN